MALILTLYLGYELVVTKTIKLYRILYYLKVDFYFIRLIVIIGNSLSVSNLLDFNFKDLLNNF